jgi:hypothetical protein
MTQVFSHLSVGALVTIGALVIPVSTATAWQANTAADAVGVAAKPGPTAMPVPFFVGERLEYDVKFGALKVGKGSMEVQDIATVNGVPAWHTMFRIDGGVLFYKVKDRYESWFDTATLTTRRYYQDIDEGSYERKSKFEFFTDRGMYQENDKPEQPTVASPLDDGSFLYFVRTIPLEVGKEYSFSRYFKPAANPVVIKVLRRDTIDVPAGRFATVVLQPTFRSKGLFSEDGKAEVWITDDKARMMVQLKTKLSIGSINLYLKSHNTASVTQK